MRKYLFIALILGTKLSQAQTGINMNNPKVNLHIKAGSNPNRAEGVIIPQLTGNALKAKDNLYGINQIGTSIYVTSPADNPTYKTYYVTKEGYYFYNGEQWLRLKEEEKKVNEATRFTGGSVYVCFQCSDVSSTTYPLPADRIIAGTLSNGNYKVGTDSATPTRGGITTIKGEGYNISNPEPGIFDIEFWYPFEYIYGISSNILDSYGGGPEGSAKTGDLPVMTEPGNPLKTTDNTQIMYISDTIIRIKTGDQFGDNSNRSFTFLVTGTDFTDDDN